MRLLFVAAVLVLLVLIAFMVVRARRAARLQREFDRGWYVEAIDTNEATYVWLLNRQHDGRRLEASIPLGATDYSNAVIEQYAAAEAKAEEWNTTREALPR